MGPQTTFCCCFRIAIFMISLFLFACLVEAWFLVRFTHLCFLALIVHHLLRNEMQTLTQTRLLFCFRVFELRISIEVTLSIDQGVSPRAL